jgi:hypothetical protein
VKADEFYFSQCRTGLWEYGCSRFGQMRVKLLISTLYKGVIIAGDPIIRFHHFRACND